MTEFETDLRTAPTCGCQTRGIIAKGMCFDHHQRWLAGEWLPPEEDDRPDPEPTECDVESVVSVDEWVRQGQAADERRGRIEALAEAREVLGPRPGPFSSTPAVDAVQLCTVAEYIRTGLPAHARPSFTIDLDVDEPSRWLQPSWLALVGSIVALVAAAVVLVLALVLG